MLTKISRGFSARAHLKESLLKFEETLRLHRMCRELKNKPGLETVLKTYHSLALNLYSKFEEKNDFRDLLEPPQIIREYVYLILR